MNTTPSYIPKCIFILILILLTSSACKTVSAQPSTSINKKQSKINKSKFPHLVDVTKRSGIDFKQSHGGSGERYYVETVGSGVGLIDFDDDGLLDIYLLNGAPLPGYKDKLPITNALYRNLGALRFAKVPNAAGLIDSNYGMGVAVGDFDNDGDQDIFISNFGPNKLYRNDDGHFADVTSKAKIGDNNFATSCTFLDYDRDGWLDLYVANYVNFTIENHIPCGLGKTNIRAYCHPDIYDGVPDKLYHNNRDGTFTDVSEEAGISNDNGKGLGVSLSDYDNDGDIDIYVANDKTPNNLWQNNGDGTFKDVALLAGVGFSGEGLVEAGMGSDFGDYDNNGLTDLFVTNFSYETNTLYHNEGNGFFTDATLRTGLGMPSFIFLGFATKFLDFDNDGRLDILIGNGHVLDNVAIFKENVTYAEPSQLFWNRGNGSFLEITAQVGADLQTPRVARAAAFGDLDNDGDLDVIMTYSNESVVLYENRPPLSNPTNGPIDSSNFNHWILIKVEGNLQNDSNRDGIGAHISLKCQGVTQLREISTAGSYLASNDIRAHFGLGDCSVIEEMEISWPSGKKETFTRINANQILLIREGLGKIEVIKN